MLSKYSINIILFILFLFSINNAQSKVIKLHLPIVHESPTQHLFYHELISTALKDIGHSVIITTEILPQQRVINYLDTGKISLSWMFKSRQRDDTYIPINVGLTNQLVGRRILFIRRAEQHLYDQVNNLDDFRKLKLVGGMGKNWYDAQVWRENDLLYKEKEGNWSAIFRRMSTDSNINYFSRGINEIIIEAKQYPELTIENRLVFIIDRDFQFYLSKFGEHAGSQYQDIILQALKKAKKSGLIDRLSEKYWGNELNKLNIENRINIHLKIPNE